MHKLMQLLWQILSEIQLYFTFFVPFVLTPPQIL